MSLIVSFIYQLLIFLISQEFDAPYELLMNKSNSMFAKMVEQTGPSMAATILHEVMEFHQQPEAL